MKRALTSVLLPFAKGFHRWDTDRNGTIEMEEFRVAMRSLKIPYAEDDDACDSLFEDFDCDSSGEITYIECLRYVLLDVMQGSVTRLHNIFKLVSGRAGCPTQPSRTALDSVPCHTR